MCRACAAACAACLMIAAGCAGPGPSGAGVEESVAALTAGPGHGRPDWAPPPGVPTDLAGPVRAGDSGYAAAMLGLDATIDELAQRQVAKPVTGAEAAAQDKDRALRLYISGREKLLGGDAPGASTDLRAATQKDPAAPEPWRELAAAQIALGIRNEAFNSLEAAAARGMAEAPGLELLGRMRLERGEQEAAAVALARAWMQGPRAADPGLPAVILAELGRSLLQMERWTAGREALRASLRELDRIPGPTRYGQELAGLARDRAAMWRDAGDAACRVGDYAAASDAYAHAAEYPSVEDLELTPRAVFATARGEGPGAAAAYLVNRARDTGDLSAGDIDLLRVLAQDPGVGAPLARALAALRDAAEGSRQRGMYTRALAAISPPGAALRELARQAAERPDDTATLRQLASAEFGDAGLDAAVGVVGRRPLAALAVAEAIYAERPDIDRVIDTLGHRGAPEAAGLLRACLEAQRGRLGRAAEIAASLRTSGGMGDAVRLVRVTTLAALGRWDEAEAELGRMAGAGGGTRITDDQRRARSRALRGLQRNKEAAAALEPLLREGNEADLLAWAELTLAGPPTPRDLDRAESVLRRVVESDPSSDRAHAMLLMLYGASGPKADAGKLAAEARSLREGGEGGRLLGLLRAQELIRRGAPAEAETILMGLAARFPADAEVLDLLCSLWEQPARGGQRHAADPVEWFTERHDRQPSDPVLTQSLARVLIAAGREKDAESLVRDRLAAGDDPRLGIVLEGILRKRPGGEDEADRIALSRLEPLPRPLPATIELAEVYTRLKRTDDAARVLLNDLPDGVPLSGVQRQQLVQVVSVISKRAQDGSSPEAREAARSLLDTLVARDVAPELHLVRLGVLARDPASTDGQLLEAIRTARQQHPELGAAPLALAVETLSGAGRADDATRLAEAAAGEADADVDTILVWVGVVARTGDAGDAERLIERTAALGRLDDMMARVKDPAGAAPRSAKAEIAYQIGLLAGSTGRRAESEAMYELALRYDPDHAWANNNLGYALADRGEQLDRAEHLLERAYAALPTEGSILDSLAWVRYRRGAVADAVDAGGNTRQGALSLLQRAYQTQSGRASPVVLDHYADALWSQGRKEEARRVWSESQRAAAKRLDELPPQSSTRQEVLDVQRRVRSKLNAARTGAPMPYEAPGSLPAGGAAGVEPGAGGGR
ncbi:MAG: tetratricopeptide repeat protein [Phycisphaerales bacterium]|nr:tetratricopeptide repeat protein [Phycisphaerales bacterium]